MKEILLTVAALCGVVGISAVLTVSPLRYWVYCLLLCIPFDIGAPIGYIPSLSVVDYFSAAALLALIIRYKPKELIKKIIEIFPASLLASWIAFLIYNALMAIVLQGSLKGMLRWGEFLFGYVMATLAVSEQDLSEPVAYILSIEGCVMASWAIFQYWHSGGDYEKTFAIFNQHNGLGAFLSLCLPASWAVLFSKKLTPSRIILVFITFLISTGFLLSYSRGAWLGMIGAVILVVLLHLMKKKSSSWFVGFGLFLIIAGAAGPVSWVVYRESKGLPVVIENLAPQENDSRFFKASQRMQYWKASTDVFRAHPWVGLGPKNYDRRIADYLTAPAHRFFVFELWYKHRIDFWQHLHNMYLQMLVEYGSIGFILWAFAFALLCLPLFQPTTHPPNIFYIAFQISGIAFLLHNTVDILFVNSFDMIFVVLIALCHEN